MPYKDKKIKLSAQSKVPPHKTSTFFLEVKVLKFDAAAFPVLLRIIINLFNNVVLDSCRN